MLALYESFYKEQQDSANESESAPALAVVAVRMLGRNNYEIVQMGKTAAEAGLMAGDLLLSVNGKSVGTQNELFAHNAIRAALRNRRPGDIVDVAVWRDKKKQIVKVPLIRAGDRRLAKAPQPIAGGNVFPNVAYDGFLTFVYDEAHDTSANSGFKLIIPLIGVEFNAADVPIRSYDFEVDFSKIK
jgi:hypothetical protein